MTALSATVGTGNIAGVATAIYIGGPGAVFWMWIKNLRFLVWQLNMLRHFLLSNTEKKSLW